MYPLLRNAKAGSDLDILCQYAAFQQQKKTLGVGFLASSLDHI